MYLCVCVYGCGLCVSVCVCVSVIVSVWVCVWCVRVSVFTLTELRQSSSSLSTVSDDNRGPNWERLKGVVILMVPTTSLWEERTANMNYIYII